MYVFVNILIHLYMYIVGESKCAFRCVLQPSAAFSFVLGVSLVFGNGDGAGGGKGGGKGVGRCRWQREKTQPPPPGSSSSELV